MFAKLSDWFEALKAQRNAARTALERAEEVDDGHGHGHTHEHLDGVTHEHGHEHDRRDFDHRHDHR